LGAVFALLAAQPQDRPDLSRTARAVSPLEPASAVTNIPSVERA
jgi:hypothetical protein